MVDGKGDLAKYVVVFIILVAAAFGSIYILKVKLKTEYPLMVVVSQSMIPTLGVGDLIFVDHIRDFDDVLAAPPPDGDILVYARSTTVDEYIVHRAVDKSLSGSGWQFVTKGDNNPVSDGRPVTENRVIGRVVGRVPVFGYFLLFIKTSRGLLLVGILMGIVYFADYLIPVREGVGYKSGRFPWAFLLPFIAAPVAYLSLWALPRSHMEIELFALASWYIGCLTAPLAFGDDDVSLMFWLYHFVFLMIPLGSDLVWMMTGITPSMWWYVQGSTMPVTWLLMEETPMLHQAFIELIRLLLPGCALFFLMLAAKRRGASFLLEATRRIRSSSPESTEHG